MRKLLLIGISTFALGAGAMAFAQQQAAAASAGPETYKMLELFGDVLTTVKRQYVTPVDDKKLIQSAIDGMLTSLDPHSGYLAPDEFGEMRDQTRGDYGGLGIVVQADEGAIKVVSPMDGAPAARAGVKAGDYITAIDGQSIVGQNANDAIKSMRGPVGTTVSVTFVRDRKDPFTVKLTREVINVHSVSHHVEGDIGYLRVASFDEKTGAETASAIRDLKAKLPHMKGLVLDLRNNPGGLVDSAVDVAGCFLDGGEVVSQRGRDPKDIQRYNARPNGDMIKGVPMVVLVNYGSASASEIVAGALKDRQRAAIVGLTSFGKGSVQTVIPLRGGKDGAVKLTTAKYYTPSGGSIQKTGIVPDLVVARAKDEAQLITDEQVDFSESSYKNALDSQDGRVRKINTAIELPPPSMDPSGKTDKDGKKVRFAGPDSVMTDDVDHPADDFQLQRAIDVLHYGGVQQAIAAKPAETFKSAKTTFAMVTPPKGAKGPTTDGGQPIPGAAPAPGVKATPGTAAAKTNTPEKVEPAHP